MPRSKNPSQPSSAKTAASALPGGRQLRWPSISGASTAPCQCLSPPPGSAQPAARRTPPRSSAPTTAWSSRPALDWPRGLSRRPHPPDCPRRSRLLQPRPGPRAASHSVRGYLECFDVSQDLQLGRAQARRLEGQKNWGASTSRVGLARVRGVWCELPDTRRLGAVLLAALSFKGVAGQLSRSSHARAIRCEQLLNAANKVANGTC